MALMSWNIRGFSHVKNKCEVIWVVEKYGIDIMGIIETKIRANRKAPTMNCFGQQWRIMLYGLFIVA